MKSYPVFVLLFAIVATFGSATHAADIDSATIEKRSLAMAETLYSIQRDAFSSIPASVLDRAKGVIILRQHEAGFIFGGKGGFGVAMIRDSSGRWGPPAWLKTGAGSWGLQFGYQKLNVVLLLMNENVLNLLYRPKFRIGIDAAATAGPVGSNVEAKLGNNTPILVYSETEGLYAGASFEGGFLVPDKKANQFAYGNSFTVPQIISGRLSRFPAFARPIRTSLENIERSR